MCRGVLPGIVLMLSWCRFRSLLSKPLSTAKLKHMSSTSCRKKSNPCHHSPLLRCMFARSPEKKIEVQTASTLQTPDRSLFPNSGTSMLIAYRYACWLLIMKIAVPPELKDAHGTPFRASDAEEFEAWIRCLEERYPIGGCAFGAVILDQHRDVQISV